MKDYEYIDENGDYIDYWTLVEDNKELCRENKQLQRENANLKKISNFVYTP